MNVSYPMPQYKNTAADVTYKELRQVLSKGITYARSHFEQARQDLTEFSVNDFRAGFVTAVKASTKQQLARVEEHTRRAQALAVASQRLYLTLSLRRVLGRFYNVLERFEKMEGKRTERIRLALDFTMRQQHSPNFLAVVALLDWNFRNLVGEYPDFPEAAILQLSESIPPNLPVVVQPMSCIAQDTMVRLESGDIVAVGSLKVGQRLLGSSVQIESPVRVKIPELPNQRTPIQHNLNPDNKH